MPEIRGEDAKRIEIMEAYIQKTKKYHRIDSHRGLSVIPSLSPIRIIPPTHITHVTTSCFGGNREAELPKDKWWKKKPVMAGESQTAVQRRLSNHPTTSYKNKSSSKMNRFEFLESVKIRSHLPAETSPEGAANWGNTALLRQTLRSIS